MTPADIIVSICTVLLASGVSLAVGLRSARAQENAAEQQTTGPNWKAFTDSLTDQMQRLEEGREDDRERIGNLETELSKVKRNLHSLRRRYVEALRHIKAVQVLWAVAQREGVLPFLPPVPDVLAADVDDPPDLDFTDPAA